VTNREIKFRAWDLNNECWYEPINEAYKGKIYQMSVCMSGDMLIRTMDNNIHQSAFDRLPNKPNYVLTEYTGIKDVNSVEIFEGDIISKSRYDAPPLSFEIKFIDGGFAFEHEGITEYIGDYQGDSMEVIGNIHQHSHLLESEGE